MGDPATATRLLTSQHHPVKKTRVFCGWINELSTEKNLLPEFTTLKPCELKGMPSIFILR